MLECGDRLKLLRELHLCQVLLYIYWGIRERGRAGKCVTSRATLDTPSYAAPKAKERN
jgi:hypothetical protein